MAAVVTRIRDIWNAYNDAGLVVIICLKLEAILCELLAKFCKTKPNADLALFYFSQYPNKENMDNVSKDIADENYSGILRNRCKMALEDLIEEIFKPTQRKWGSPADHFHLSRHDNALLDQINKLRYKIVHYGEETDDSAILGHLTAQERIDIVSNYKQIIRDSSIFIKVYPDNTECVSEYQ